MRTSIALLVVAGLTGSAGPVTAQTGGTAGEDALALFSGRLEAARTELIDVRRDLHRNPELSGQEERTARIVAERLAAAGFEVRTGVGGHGVVGLLTGAEDGPLLAFRADMDAVRSNAPDPVEFGSEVNGVRHICGHDIHTTIGLALAEGLSSIRDRLEGSAMLIFQPAEESATGAEAMLADGVFGDRVPDAVFSFHTAPFEVGQVATASRTLMPGRDVVRVDVSGTGDLESIAERVREVVRGAATLGPDEALTPAAGDFVLGQGVRASRGADGWTVGATFTTSSLEASAGARRTIERGLADMQTEGVTLDLDYRERVIAGVTNSPALVEAANATARDVLGENAVLMLQAMTPVFSEDFGSFQRHVPGVMYFLGVSNSERGWVGMPHSPDYVADEEAIFVGARTMAAILLGLYAEGVPGSLR